MITERYEVFSLEEGDTIIFRDYPYVIEEIESHPEGYRLHVRDEEGFHKAIDCHDDAKFRVIINENEESE